MFGTTRENEKDNFGDFTNEFVIKEPGIYPIRFLAGAVRVSRVFLPVIAEDENGEPHETWRTILRGQSGSVFGVLASIDKKIKRNLGWDPKEITSIFDPSKRFAYLGIPKVGGDLMVQPILVPWKIHEGLKKIQDKVSGKDPDRLLYGLYFMYDVLCERSKDRTRSDRFGTSYAVEVDNSENSWAHLCPVDWLPSRKGMPSELDALNPDLLSKKNFPPIFSNNDRELIGQFIQDNSIDDTLLSWLEQQYRLPTDEELFEFFSRNKINTNALAYGDRECFPDPEAFYAELENNPRLKEFGINLLETNSSNSIEPEPWDDVVDKRKIDLATKIKEENKSLATKVKEENKSEEDRKKKKANLVW